MRAYGATAVAFVSLVLSGCGSSFRDEATRLLIGSAWFKSERTENIPFGKYCFSPASFLKDEKAAIAELWSTGFMTGIQPPFSPPFLKGVVNAKPINVTEQVRWGPMPAECRSLLGDSSNFFSGLQAMGRQFWSYDVSITQQAVAAGVPRTGGLVVIGTKEIIAITGVVQHNDVSDVEFIWQWKKNKFSEAFPESFEGMFDWIPSLAKFKRYDDGWRLQSIACGDGSPLVSEKGPPYPGCPLVVTDPLPTAYAYYANPPASR